MNITLDDTSPQFLYYSTNETWRQEHPEDDQTGNYFKKTFMATKTDGDSASFTFNGTAVYIYGAKRDNHGTYSTQLDGGSVTYQKGYDGKLEMQAVIFSAVGLSAEHEHTVILTNLPSQTTPPGNATLEWWFDVDYAIVTTSMTGKVYTTTIDTSSAAEYFGSAWARGQGNKDLYNTTGHYTSNPGDYVQLSFNGSSVQMFGSLGDNHGNYSVSLDGSEPSVYNGTFFRSEPGVALYTASGLKDGPHTITMTNLGLPDLLKLYFGFNWAVVNSTIDPTTVDSGTTGTNVTDSVDGQPLNPVGPEGGGSTNIAAIAGGVVGGVVGLALVAMLAWFLHKRSKRNEEGLEYVMRSTDPMDLDGGEVKPYHYSSNAYHRPLPSSSSSDAGFPQTEIAQQSIPAAREIDHSGTPFLTAIPAPPPSNATSYPRSVVSPAQAETSPSVAQHSASARLNTANYATPSAATFGHRHETSPQTSPTANDGLIVTPSPAGAGTAQGTNRSKTAGVALPYTARPPPVDTPTSSGNGNNPDTSNVSSQPTLERQRASSFGSQRMYVPGREQDMGPVPVLPGDGDEEVGGGEQGTLPPDYHQATEPFPGQRRP
ncbi:hypothetical protein I317_07217 [Kwoniella heveanensis CBS 569]|nr:hypothetical protein I317_07217 [Kwoniella heveanensis CBS 569]